MDVAEMISLSLSYNGMEFSVEVDKKTYDDLMQDPTNLKIYAEQVYRQLNNEGLHIDSSKLEPSYNNFNNEKAITDFKWNDKNIKLLLQIRLKMEKEYNKPSCKKIKLWRNVAREINEVGSLNVTAEICDCKYRNLLTTYRSNKKKQSSTGESAIKWEYFEIFDEVLGTKASSIPQPKTLGESFKAEEILTTETEDDSEIETVSVLKTDKIKSRKRKNEMSLQGYLWEKLNRDEELQKEKKKKEEERLKAEKERWNEKKELKEKEISAILALAKAISEKK